jgi:hypothetical protein
MTVFATICYCIILAVTETDIITVLIADDTVCNGNIATFDIVLILITRYYNVSDVVPDRHPIIVADTVLST